MNRSIIYCLLLCIFLACGDNDYETLVPEEVAPGDSTDPGDTTETLEDYWNYFCHGYQVKDTSGLNRVFLNPFYPENEEVVYLSGIRNNRLWVGTFDATTRKQTSDFLDSEPLPDSYSHHVGYGEYKTGELTSPIISFIEQKGDHTTILFKLALGENENAGWYERDYRLLLFAGNLISKKYIYYSDYYNSDFMLNWYNNSYIAYLEITDDEAKLSNGIYTCFDKTGEVLFTTRYDFYWDKTHYPINYKNSIVFSARHEYNEDIYRLNVYITDIDENRNFEEGKKIPLFELNPDDLYEVTELGENEEFKSFQLNITEYSGNKYSRTVNIHIKTHEVQIK